MSNSFVTLWTVAHQAPLSMVFFRQEYWCGLPCPPPGDLPNLGIKLICSISYISRWVLYHLPPFQGVTSEVFISLFILASLVAQLVKNLPAIQKAWVQSLGWEDPLEKEMVTHSSILA